MPSLKQIKVLIVDDEPDICELLQFEFEKIGCTVLTALNGVEALKVISKGRVDVVVSDIRMPQGNGIMLLDKLKEKNNELPVVLFLSGHADITLEEAYNRGAEAIFTKPFDRKAIVEAVQKNLLPLVQKWKGFDPQKYKTLKAIEMDFDSFEGASNKNQFQLGRGGFAILVDKINFKRNEQVRFHVSFKKDGFGFEGLGSVLWVSDDESAKKVLGIEFLNLTEKSIEACQKLIDPFKCKSFVPKI